MKISKSAYLRKSEGFPPGVVVIFADGIMSLEIYSREQGEDVLRQALSWGKIDRFEYDELYWEIEQFFAEVDVIARAKNNLACKE